MSDIYRIAKADLLNMLVGVGEQVDEAASLDELRRRAVTLVKEGVVFGEVSTDVPSGQVKTDLGESVSNFSTPLQLLRKVPADFLGRVPVLKTTRTEYMWWSFLLR